MNDMSKITSHRLPQNSMQVTNQPSMNNEFGMNNTGLDSINHRNNLMERFIPDNYMRIYPNNQIPFSVNPLSQPVQTMSSNTKSERRTKNYSYSQYKPPPNVEEFLNLKNSNNIKRRSGPNNRVGLNKERITETLKKDSHPFQINEENNPIKKVLTKIIN